MSVSAGRAPVRGAECKNSDPPLHVRSSGSSDPLDAETCASWLKPRLPLSEFDVEEHWSPTYSQQFLEWCQDSSQHKLFVYFGQVKAPDEPPRLVFSRNRVPSEVRSGQVREFVFFGKRTAAPLTKATLNEHVFFSCIRGDMLKSLITLLSGVYVPFSMKERGWPENVRKDFTGQLQRFLASVTETVYQAKGATLLYVPIEDLSDLGAALKDKDLVQRLEATVIYWTRQIKEVMMVQDTTQDADNTGHLDEIRFWRERAVNFSRLMEQFKSQAVLRIFELLELSKSTYLKQFRAVQADVHQASLEAEDNLKFLSALEKPSEKLAQAKPEAIPPILQQLLNSVRMIWSTSTYYNTSDRISGLLRKISAEVIKRCQAAIDLSLIWSGVVDNAITSLQQSTECGRAWKRLYQQMCKLVRRHSSHGRHWDFPEGAVFAEIDAFVQRCCDLLEVCECQRHFNTRAQQIALPMFAGFRFKEVSRSIYEIEDAFAKGLRRLRDLDYFVLDVKATKWHDDFAVFKNQVKDLEFMYTNVITSAFDGVQTVDAACQVYDAFYLLAKRTRIKKFLEKKNADVWNRFIQDLALVKRQFECIRKNPPQALSIPYQHPSHAGLGLWTRGLILKIQAQMDTLDAMYYMPPCREADVARESFSSIRSMLVFFVEQSFEEWCQELSGLDGGSAALTKRLERPLLVRTDANILTRGRGGQLESNFDKTLIKNLQEAYFWQKMHNQGINLPYAAHEMLRHRDKLIALREHVARVVREYNLILDTIAPDERRLFQQHIHTLDKRIAPGIQKLTWNSKGIKEFFVRDTLRECQIVYGFVRRFQTNHQTILAHCKAISELHFISIDRRKIYADEEFRHEQATKKREIEDYLSQAHKAITDILQDSHRLFEEHPFEIQREWKCYVEKVDKRVGDALKKAVRTSLQDLSKVLNPAGGKTSTLDVVPLFKVHAVLDSQNRMDFKPSMADLKELLQTVCKDLCLTLQVVPRLREHLQTLNEIKDASDSDKIESESQLGDGEEAKADDKKLPSTFYEMVSKDDDCVRIVIQIMKGLANCASKLQERLKWWRNNYQPIVSQNREEIIRKYARTERPLPVICTNIQRYKELQADIQQEEFKITICFIEGDFTILKQALTNHCQQWLVQLEAYLHRNATRAVENLLDYFQTNAESLRKVPQTTEEIREKLHLWHKCKGDVPYLEERIRPIDEQFAKLFELGVQIPEHEEAQLQSLRRRAEEFEAMLEETEAMLSKTKKAMSADMERLMHGIERQAADLLKKFQASAPFDGLAFNYAPHVAFHTIALFRAEVEKLRESETQLKPKLAFFQIECVQFSELAKMEGDFQMLTEIWTLVEEWNAEWSAIQTQALCALSTTELDRTADAFQSRLTKMEEIRTWPVWRKCQREIDQFRKGLPLVSNLRSPALRERHWARIKKEVAEPFDPQSSDFTLNAVVQLDLIRRADLIGRLADEARKEYKIESALQEIASTWANMRLDVGAHKETLLKLKGNEELFNILEENILTLSVMKSNQYHLPFKEEVEHWEKTLAHVSEVIETILQVQKQWLYLENVFRGSDDIRQMLAQEAEQFDSVHVAFVALLSRVRADSNVLRTCALPGVLRELIEMNETLERLQKSLDDYLEEKRQEFPRFYFLSNSDLLEILGHSKEPDHIQKHIKKLFEGTKLLDLLPPGKRQNKTWDAEGLIGQDGEKVKFQPKHVVLEGPVECWLGKVEKSMRETLKRQLLATHQANLAKGTKKERWLKESCGQLTITSSQIAWTTDTETALRKVAKGSKNALKQLKKQQCRYLTKLIDLVRQSVTPMEQAKLVALITIEVHARDVQERLIQMRCESDNCFAWKSQLRFELREDSIDDRQGNGTASQGLGFMGCQVLQTETVTTYGYEYQGNNGRLVITPLTDKCYMTLTMALHLKLGGCPQGPAGTGKTETVRDLGKSIAKLVLVFNCSDALDYISLGRIFSGLAQSGTWGCFDEFNRIEIEVLSVVAQQISVIQHALRPQNLKFLFEGQRVRLDPCCGIFITMNPGYAGRTELPDNLTSLFRPVSMMSPDLAMICEIVLLAEGFEDARVLSRKIITLYQLMSQQLSKQDHYDFGLRAIRSVLSRAGQVRRSGGAVAEHEVLIRAIIDLNASKTVTDDGMLFTALMRDLFPETDISQLQSQDPVLKQALEWALEDAGLQRVEHIVTKATQLFLTMETRHGNMLVGKSLTGKTTAWTMLQKALCRLSEEGHQGFEPVRTFVINPKSVDVNELYGSFNIQSLEWVDGILSAVMRAACQDSRPTHKWIVLDGPVDTLWIESMNSLLDDNKTLTLINGDCIAMPPQVSLLFEVENLSAASPATVSRVGMVYMDPGDLDWNPHVQSWLAKHYQTPELRSFVADLFSKYLEKVLKVRRECTGLVPITDMNGVMSLCKLYEIFSERLSPELQEEKLYSMMEKTFAFAVIWSLGASVDAESRPLMDRCIRQIEPSFPPGQTVYDYFLNYEKQDWKLWEDRLPSQYRPLEGTPFHKILVPTVDVLRNSHLLNGLILRRKHALCVGRTGTGKTASIVATVLHSLSESTHMTLTINFSAQTSSRKTQEIVEGKLEKRVKDRYGPPGNKRLVCFIDDLNMPRKDTFGSQPPLELLRQLTDYGCWYDRQKQTVKHIQDTQIVAAMGPPGGGRSVIPMRLQTRFNLINFTDPGEQQVKRIFNTLALHKFSDFKEDIKGAAESIAAATIALYEQVRARFLPKPDKPHYLFNMRDISRVFQGLYQAELHVFEDKDSVLRLWIHECLRVFHDRLTSHEDRSEFFQLLDGVAEKTLQVSTKEICKGERNLIFVALPFDATPIADAPYEEARDKQHLKQFLTEKLDEYNENSLQGRMPLVLFRDAIEHCCRIFRILCLPNGHATLVGVGGSGRHSLTTFACFLAKQQCFQIEITRNYGHAEFQEDLKKLFNETGVEGKPTTFLLSDSEILTEAFVEDVHNMLSSGEVPNLFSAEELGAIASELERAAKAAGIRTSDPDAIHDFFLSRVRENLHIIFCVRPIGNLLRDCCRNYPGFVNNTTIDWFFPWPADALIEVAATSLSDSTVDEAAQTAAAEVVAAVHASVVAESERMFLEMKRRNYVTPTKFLELVQGYIRLYREKTEEVEELVHKLSVGLDKLVETRAQVEVMGAELETKKEVVAKKQIECQDLLVVIVEKRRVADEQKKQVEADSERISKEEVETKLLSEDARRDLAKAMPALEAAIDALEKLDKKSVAEVKAYTKPPDLVVKTMAAVMTVMEKTPSWAQAKVELNDPSFLTKVKNFDKDSISNNTLKKIEKFTKDPTFAPNNVLKVSRAAGALCLWVHAMQMYAEVYREVEPKRLRLRLAEEQLEKKQMDLLASTQRLQDIQQRLEELKVQYNDSIRTKDELNASAEELKLKMERAESLITGLAGERDRWEVSLAQYTEKLKALPGDCLLAAAFMSYAGPFNTVYRNRLVSENWVPLVHAFQIPHNPSFDFADFLAKPIHVRQWNLQGLPSDRFSTENGVLVTQSRRWPLMIDPQSQATKWIRKMEAARDLRLIDAETKDYMRVITMAVENGKPVMMERVQNSGVDPALDALLAQRFIDVSGAPSIRIGDIVVRYNPSFRFYLTTKQANPHFMPELASSVNLVNCIVKEDGLTAQLLAIVVMNEEPRLEEQKNELVVKLAEGRRRLQDLEDEILRLLTNSQGSLLDDVELIAALQESKAIAEEVTRQIEVSEQTMQKIDQARDAYKPCGIRASVLYFVLHDLILADPMYQFSLDAYVELFISSIEKAKEDNAMTASVEEHVEILNSYHTLAVYRNACLGLFEKHKLLLSLHLATSVLQSRGQLNKEEYQFLLGGGAVADRKNQPQNPDPDWISQHAWDCICELDKLPSFQGFQTSYEQTLRDWRKWHATVEPEHEALPGEWQARLDALQRLLIIRSLRSDRFLPAASRFVADTMDARFVEAPPLDLEAVFNESKSTVPLIFVLSKVDPTGQLMALASAKNVQAIAVALGQGQSARAERLIREGARHGFWVFLANCHLALSWLPAMEKLIEEVIDSGPHENYRLWLSSEPHPDFPIALLQRSTKITTEPPKGLKSNLQRLLLQRTEEDLSRAKVPDDRYRRLFFSLCWLHAVLLERRKFKGVGWNVPYDFNDSDFIVSDNILAIYAEQYSNDMPWEALRYMVAEACYGGRVTDDKDMRLLHVYCVDFFGPHVLQSDFKFTPSGAYYIPEDSTITSLKTYVRDLPVIDPPEIFSQHVNAEISSQIADAESLLATLLLLQPPGSTAQSTGGPGKPEEHVYKVCEAVEQTWPADIDYPLIVARSEGDVTPLRVVLLQEIQRYNKLLRFVRESLEALQKGLLGLAVMSDEVELVMQALEKGAVPEAWKFAYPSVKPLSSWVLNLRERIDFLSAWGLDRPPKVFWLGGFTYPSGFLTALLQQFGRRNTLSVDVLNFDFLVQTTSDETQIAQAPKEGAYIKKLYLEGAAWNVENHCLRDSEPMKLIADMPIIHFKPVARKRVPTETIYSCPLYAYPIRSGTRERPSFVTSVELKSGGYDASFWVKRGTALLLSKGD
ncbi:dynein, axonemal, heavy chain 2 family protein [Besnoitia besnoiti]|uniref:Dynein-1, subspecies f n=1 Tax=Besnoitia besnoiti TaxID=94643 RepID=A0A2A9MH66_BESBE|nr:dynein, axonemal, heavy chain 2 family protein [Besnoitia besnoiti]PFH37249.1 dynein, axonemal, heavy chain 2 family protein [Besnoitia besnoiti]